MTKPVVLRLTLTSVIEFEAVPENYPEGQRTPEAMLAMEIKQANENPSEYESMDSESFTVTGEIIGAPPASPPGAIETGAIETGELSAADHDAIDRMPMGRWFEAESLPFMVKRPLWRCQRLVRKGVLESRVVGDIPNLKTEFRMTQAGEKV